MNGIAPVQRAAGWGDLIAEAGRQPGLEALRTATPGVARGVLAAPAAIAYWIANSGTITHSRARLLMIGAEKLDAVDEGRWYQMIPALLGRPMSVEVTLVGDRLDRRFESPLAAIAPRPAARMHVGRLSDYIAAEGDPAADVAFLFHPGFQKHRGWLEDGSLRRLHALGIPVVTLSYEADESELERWVVGCYGFDAVQAPLLNPFYIDFSDDRSQIHWGRALWRFWPRPGAAADVAVDQARLDALDRLGDMVLHSIDLGRSMRASYGQMVTLKVGQAGSRRFIYVFDDFLLDPLDATLYGVDAGRLEKSGTLTAPDLEGYPGETAPELERAVWAAGIKARYLLDRYGARIEPAALHRRARAMHADLEGKVDALFRT